MTLDSENVLDIVRRIATHLKEDDEPERRTVAEPAIDQDKPGPDSRRATGPAAPEPHPADTGKETVTAKTGLRSERGFTLPELLITTVLVAGSAGLIATAIYQIFVVSQDGNARLAVLGDVQNAAIWIGRDSSESASWTAGSGSEYGTLTTGDPTVQFRYSYDAATTSLVREQLVSGSPVSTLNIARRIAGQGDVSFSVTGSLLTVSITGTSGPTSESSTLKLGMRVK